MLKLERLVLTGGAVEAGGAPVAAAVDFSSSGVDERIICEATHSIIGDSLILFNSGNIREQLH